MTLELPLFRHHSPHKESHSTRRISVLGATGSIGDSTLEVLLEHPEKFEVVALVGGANAARMAELAQLLNPDIIAMDNKEAADELRSLCSCPVLSSRQGVMEAASIPCDICVAAITGFSGLEPVIAAIEAGADIALAHKESMVCAGEFVIKKARKHKVNILPVDSEHSALFQCLIGQDLSSVQSIILTASGGPFRTFSPTELLNVTTSQALTHPNWSMGSKVTIDSATLMNKGLEIIEAKQLFNINHDALSAVIHPQSIVHSFVHYKDGSYLAQMGEPTMVSPIAVALGWPQRLTMTHHPVIQKCLDPVSTLNRWSGLHFESIDTKRFPCFQLALDALALGGHACVVLNAANEIAVERFLNGEIRFQDIAQIVEAKLHAMEKSGIKAPLSLDDVCAIDSWTREINFPYNNLSNH